MGLAERCLERLATVDPASQVVSRHLGRCGLREVFHGQFRLPDQTVVVDCVCVHTLRLFLSILPRAGLLEPFGTRVSAMEPPGTRFSALGTEPQALLGTPAGLLERAPALLELPGTFGTTWNAL